MAQTFTPYSRFDNMTLQELATLQVKLTYVGPQSKALPSVLGSSKAPDIALFKPFRRPGISYSNDEIPSRTFTATTNQLLQMLNNVGTLTAVTAGGVQTPNFLSFALHSTLDGGIAFEVILNQTNTVALFNKLRAPFSANADATMAINVMGCALEANPAGLASDVTANVTVTLSGVRLDHKLDRFVGTLTAKNVSASAISGPISVVLTLPPTIYLADVDGYTCKRAPAGRRYINLPGSLGAGQSAVVEVGFENPDREQISATFQVLAGTGAR